MQGRFGRCREEEEGRVWHSVASGDFSDNCYFLGQQLRLASIFLVCV